MNTETKKTAPLEGSARRALITAAVFAFLYILWDILSVYYFPSALNSGRRPLLERLALFLLSGALFCFFAIKARREGSVPGDFQREVRILLREPVFWILAVWFVWACISMVLAYKEGYVALLHDGSFLFDQFINSLLLFPLGYYLARRRDDRLLTALALACFLCFLPYAAAGTVFSFTHRPFSFLGRMIELGDWERLRLGGNPNTAGIYGALAFTAGLYLMTKTHHGALRALLALGNALIIYVLFLTGSRGGMASAALGLAYFALMLLLRRLPRKNRSIPKWVWGVCAAVFFLLLAAAVVIFLRRMTGRELVTDNPTERAYLWALVIQDITGNPHFLLHGISSAAVPYLIGQHYGLYVYNAHNQLLEVWLGHGTPGLCLFAAYLILLAGRCLRLCFAPADGNRRADWAAVLFILTPLFNSMVEVILLDTMTTHAGLFALASGTVFGMASLLREEGREPA